MSALGIEADKIDEIISAHTETVDGLKEQLKQAKEAADKLPKVQEQLDSLKDAAKNSGDYAKLKKEFDDYKAIPAEQAEAAAEKPTWRRPVRRIWPSCPMRSLRRKN